MLAVWISGCGEGPQAEFKLRESTENLIPSARSAVEELLKKDFGVPNALVFLDRFPVDYGGAKGSVSTVTGNKTLIVTVDGDAARIRKGASIVWLTGALATTPPAARQTVSSFDETSKQLVLAGGTTSPAVGDQFAVGSGDDLQLGKQVYMKNCLHCHGVAGDGAGPTGQYLNPRPRDYRNGVFKFTSTQSGEKPTRDDLSRIVKDGVPGTYMPSFRSLGERETKSVVEYVRWLSIRGEFEKRLVAELTSDFSQAAVNDTAEKATTAHAEKVKDIEKIADIAERSKAKEALGEPLSREKLQEAAEGEFAKYQKDDLPDVIEETADFLTAAWTRAEEPSTIVVPSVPRVEDTPESRERGRLLYLSDQTKCYTCHGMTGRGDGSATEDFWPKPGTKVKYGIRGLHDEWGQPLPPRNLTLGQYRGGRRPIDLFRRMYVGIKGTPMPAFGRTGLKDNEIWDVVNYVMSLPYATKSASPAAGQAMKVEEKRSQ